MSDKGKENMKFRVAELVICLVAVAAGLVYLNTDLIPLGVMLPFFSVMFAALPIISIIEARMNGIRGVAVLLSVIGRVLIELVLVAATVAYFVM
ncbi:MAG: hypothetical protein E7638_03820 [Ruminococcaceae bacterium]|nr:hypothetical protein [Oscillospiraceae bacterium]